MDSLAHQGSAEPDRRRTAVAIRGFNRLSERKPCLRLHGACGRVTFKVNKEGQARNVASKNLARVFGDFVRLPAAVVACKARALKIARPRVDDSGSPGRELWELRRDDRIKRRLVLRKLCRLWIDSHHDRVEHEFDTRKPGIGANLFCEFSCLAQIDGRGRAVGNQYQDLTRSRFRTSRANLIHIIACAENPGDETRLSERTRKDLAVDIA